MPHINMSSASYMDLIGESDRQTAFPEPTYFLSAQAYCCEFDDGAIILDLRGGTYLGIDAEHLPSLKACVGNWPNSLINRSTTANSADFERLIAALLARKIITTNPERSHKLDLDYPATTPARLDWTARQPRISIGQILQFSGSLLLVLLSPKRKRLAFVFAWIRRRQLSIHRDDNSMTSEAIGDLLNAFFRLRLWFYTAYRHCLFDSLVLGVFLTRHMVPSTVVIGVSTKPFAAHSWVQIGECVLNDTVEHVQTFKPILAIGELN
jgi:hypothetical protein